MDLPRILRLDTKTMRALFAGVLYLVITLVTARMAGTAGPGRGMFLWRLSAFALCGVVVVAHVAWEHFRLRSSTRSTALQVALGAAIGGFLIALAANVHDLGSAAGYRPRMLVALVAWPLLTAVPAFLVALAAAAVLGRFRRAA